MKIVRSSKCSHLFSAVLLLCIVRSKTQQICGRNNTSAEFENNFNTVLRNLVKNTSPSNGFNTSVYGESPDKVYGLLQCIGGTTAEECMTCSHQANDTIRNYCGNARGGSRLLRTCFIRYEDYPFFGILDTKSSSFSDELEVTDEPGVFRKSIREMFTNLSNEALQSPLRYSGSRIIPTSYPIYTMVQCWRDLTSAKDCQLCLNHAIDDLLSVTFTSNQTLRAGATLSGSCFARYETYRFFNPAPPPPPSSSPPLFSPVTTLSKKSPPKIGVILGIASGCLVVLLICLVAIWRKFMPAGLRITDLLKKENRTGAGDNLYREVDSQIGEDIIFNLKNIKVATKNFHEDNKLGEGGFGSVYKGKMANGIEIAVKKHSVQSSQGKEQFLNEVKLVAKINHRNLVKLLGCCTEESEWLLVYEFLPNNSLDKILFDPERSKELDWHRRFNIILGIARGLLYLHEDSQVPIIHRDIKASNILLDEKMEPKISDFGLARLFQRDMSKVNTRVAGTLGYMAPEYALGGQLSIKADIYSFGVLILEIICRRKNIDDKLSSEFLTLVEWVWISYKEGNIMDVTDREMIDPNKHVLRCIHVGLLCVQENASYRPTMTNVYKMLSKLSIENLPEPTKPPYIHVAQINDPENTSAPFSIHFVYPSTNDASISDLGPR